MSLQSLRQPFFILAIVLLLAASIFWQSLSDLTLMNSKVYGIIHDMSLSSDNNTKDIDQTNEDGENTATPILGGELSSQVQLIKEKTSEKFNNIISQVSAAKPGECSDFRNLTLFMPLAPTDDSLLEFQEVFYTSFKLFWPANQILLDLILDAEVVEIQEFAQDIIKTSSPSHPVSVSFGDPPTFHLDGHDRQQWLMFWADNFTSSDYIGFVDSDALFVTRVLDSDLFVNGKPRIIGWYGAATGYSWELVPAKTFLALGMKEPFRTMTYFPVLVKRDHLKEIREQITRNMNSKSFDEAFQQIIVGKAYSQFNIITTYLWHKKRDEYFWDITERVLGWSGYVEGQVASKEEAGITHEMLTQNRRPYLSIHKIYEDFSQEDADISRAVQKVMTDGYCWSLRFDEKPLIQKCSSINRSDIFRWQWTFERVDFSQRDETKSAHMRRLAQIDKCPAYRWDINLLKSLNE